MMFGLPERTLKQILDYFSHEPHILKVIVYGSRAMGREQPGSDIDLAIITDSEKDLSGKIKLDLEDLPTPYLFDVIDYQKITHAPLQEHIDRVGKVLYTR
jgi:predicted nucleotidyltransferase